MENPLSIIATVGLSQRGIHETSNNQGPGIEKYWLATTYPEGMKDRQPWCSAYVSWCVQEADRQSTMLNLRIPPRWPAVAQWKPWALRDDVGAEVHNFGEPNFTPQAGDIVIFLPHFSHVGIVTSFDGELVHTVEGNSNDDGSREGREVVEQKRRPGLCGSFIRLPLTPQIVTLPNV